MNKAISNAMSFHTQIKHSGMQHNVENLSDADLEVALQSAIRYENRNRQVAIEAEIARRIK